MLYDNFLQAQILSQEAVTSAHHMEAYEDLMIGLETQVSSIATSRPSPTPRRWRSGGGRTAA